MRKVDLPRKELELMYLRQKKTTYDIARHYKCCQATVWKRLHQYRIPVREARVGIVRLSKEMLIDLYINKRLSTWAIEKKYGYNRSLVHRRLLKYGIKRRDSSESHLHSDRRRFSGCFLEKAYMIGFAIGDLRVRKQGGIASQTLFIACSSTKEAQIDLIRSLFSCYGHIWESKPSNRGVIFIEASVDLSFEFLCVKTLQKEHDWMVNGEIDHFYAFLAGFTDAEGSISVDKKGHAKIPWGNYDRVLLEKIAYRLRKEFLLIPKIVNDHLRGYQGRDGYRRKKDYHHLQICRKKVVEEILYSLLPYMRHSDKVKAANKALKSIKERNSLYGNIHRTK